MAIAFLLANSATAQKTVYSLEACKEMALQNNLTLQSGLLDISMASQQRKEAFTHYFPVIGAQGMAFNSNKSIIQASVDLPILSFMGMGAIPLNLLKNGKAGAITAIQPVFMGGQIINGNKLARIGQEVARFQHKLSEDEVKIGRAHV